MKKNTLIKSVTNWIDADSTISDDVNHQKINWIRALPFIVLHLGCFGLIFVGVNAVSIAVMLGMYFVRMFAITGFYHRYFSHKSFKTNRVWQFIFALLGASATQRGPLWWAAHHRHHHKYSDQINDTHSPKVHGFFWSHVGWFLSDKNFATQQHLVKDLMRFPELRLLNRFDTLVPIGLIVLLFFVGNFLNLHFSSLKTNGWQLVVWGYFVSTVILFHATCSINSLSHTWGSRSYPTRDQSRNNFLLALITLGEGWHNNHHYYPGSTRQGFKWWQIDITYYLLWLMSKIGIIHDMRPAPNSPRITHE